MKTLLTGLKPSGDLHIGNYLGTGLPDWKKWTGEYSCIFFIPDLHSLTEEFEPGDKTEQILRVAAAILALGIDPDKCIFFRQADVLEHTNLMWIFNCITSMGQLERMTQYKDKVARKIENNNAGLFTYPVLQAADILLYEPDVVPVGIDQKQHIELTRDIAVKFNNRFGQTFKLPEPQFSDFKKVMSLTDPESKMSKSHGEKSYIALHDEPEVIMEKMKKAVTDEVGLKNLYDLANYFIPGFDAKQYTDQNAKFKEDLAVAIADHFADFRKKRLELLAHPENIIQILQKGAEKARAIANPKLIEAWKKIGLIG
ncbi:MAG: tryptophan--tRNA ligase [Patescibacteria group bacterium]